MPYRYMPSLVQLSDFVSFPSSRWKTPTSPLPKQETEKQPGPVLRKVSRIITGIVSVYQISMIHRTLPCQNICSLRPHARDQLTCHSASEEGKKVCEMQSLTDADSLASKTGNCAPRVDRHCTRTNHDPWSLSVLPLIFINHLKHLNICIERLNKQLN